MSHGFCYRDGVLYVTVLEAYLPELLERLPQAVANLVCRHQDKQRLGEFGGLDDLNGYLTEPVGGYCGFGRFGESLAFFPSPESGWIEFRYTIPGSYEQAVPGMASLNFLLFVLAWLTKPDGIASPRGNQLVIREGGSYSVAKEVGDWLWSQPIVNLPIAQAIAEVYASLHSQLTPEEIHLGLVRPSATDVLSKPGGATANIYGRSIHLNYPGGAATGLDAEMARENRGYRVVPHNVDVPAQDLGLLVGMAKLHELVEAGIDSQWMKYYSMFATQTFVEPNPEEIPINHPTEAGVYEVRGEEYLTIEVYQHPVLGLSVWCEDADRGVNADTEDDVAGHIRADMAGINFVRRLRPLQSGGQN
ncbi:MAG: hypothetical protein WC553_00550 [Patescibacteria group bacterium]